MCRQTAHWDLEDLEDLALTPEEIEFVRSQLLRISELYSDRAYRMHLYLDQGESLYRPTVKRENPGRGVGKGGACSIANMTRNVDDRHLRSAEWARVGGGFSVEPAEYTVVIEDLLIRSARQAPADYRLFFVSATWLGVHHHFVDMRRFGRELVALRGLDSAVAGAMISVDNQVAESPQLEAAERHCHPFDEPHPLFDRVAQNSLLREFARQDALPVFARWGLWQDEVSLKIDAVKPVGWILDWCPELRVRALTGASLEGEIVEALLTESHTIAAMACTTKSSYASAHEAAGRLAARGLIERLNENDRRGLTLESIERWIAAYPASVASRARQSRRTV